jgi:hypothetical protein
MSGEYCESCKIAPLECLCCCKERAILQSLLKRLNAYQCYLRPILINASCEQLSKSDYATHTSSVIGGGQNRFGLHMALDSSNLPNRLRIPLLAGCHCSRLSIQQKIYYHDTDCYGYASRGNVDEITDYLNNTFSTDAGNEAFDLLTNTATNNQPTVRIIRGATLILEESKRVYNAMLEALPC